MMGPTGPDIKQHSQILGSLLLQQQPVSGASGGMYHPSPTTPTTSGPAASQQMMMQGLLHRQMSGVPQGMMPPGAVPNGAQPGASHMELLMSAAVAAQQHQQQGAFHSFAPAQGVAAMQGQQGNVPPGPGGHPPPGTPSMPSAADACTNLVHKLMCYRQVGLVCWRLRYLRLMVIVSLSFDWFLGRRRRVFQASRGKLG